MGLLYIIRHGKPEFRGEKRCIGTTDLPLSEEGREQMREVCERLRHANIRRIFVSPLARTRESAEILSEGMIPITEIPELREIDMGVWENQTFSRIRRDYPEEYEARGRDFAGFRPQGGETFRECQQRAYLAYRKILAEAEGNVALVAHAGVNRALISFLEGRELSQLLSIPQPYGNIYQWDIGPRLGAVIVAGGRSSRMGKLKPLLPIGEDSLLERECKSLFRAGARRVTVVTGREAARVEAAVRGPGVVCVENKAYETTGMLESVCLGLKATPRRLDGVYFLPADAPLFSLYTLRKEEESFLREDADIFRPVYRGLPGHPLLIRRAIFEEIYEYDGARGLQGFCEQFSQRCREVSTPDPGILMDADVPEDYQALLDYETAVSAPSRERCREIMAWKKLPPALEEHCLAVAQKALELAEAYNRAGGDLDRNLVEAGALLHDLEKMTPHHAEAAYHVLCQLGFARIADVVRYHEHLPEELQGEINEMVIVYLADKLVLGSRPCTLQERYDHRRAEFSGNPMALEAIDEKQKAAERMYRRYQQAVEDAGEKRKEN